MTRRWRFQDAPTAGQAHEIATTLLEGGIVVMPTDTIYGFHAIASNATAVEKIADIKGRDDSRPFIVLAASIEQLQPLGITLDPAIGAALDALWPAPLTAVLPLVSALPASRGTRTLAVRIPALGWLRDLLTATGPLVSTSANRSGEAAVHELDELADDLLRQVDGVVDGGRRDGNASAIVDLTADEPRFIREGDQSFTQLLRKILWKTR